MIIPLREGSIMDMEMMPIGGAMAPDFPELNRIESELLETVNSARHCFERGECGSAAYDEALKTLNQFAVAKPISGDLRLIGLEDSLERQ
jgi:hypothetical protein